MYREILKPLADRLVAAVALLLSTPLLIPLTLILTIVNRGRPFFFQIRPGRHGRHFRLVKFRSMTTECDDRGKLLPDEQRLTLTGKFIRKTSLDELPQLYNVLKGDMSFVGPRPLLVEYLSRYNQRQAKRHEVRPGITGWAQVNGRNTVRWPERLEMDVYYVENQSFLLDLRILWLTVFKVFRREGISSTTSSTMEKFTGKE